MEIELDKLPIIYKDNVKDIYKFKRMMLLYNSAIKEINTKIEILNDDFKLIHQYNPIEYTKSRLKSPESIVDKLKRKGYNLSMEVIESQLNDIAGIRIICSFTSDIYNLANMIAKQNDIKVKSVKDYIANPKPNGYRSYHMLVEIPIFLTDKVENVKVEIQIRTIAMDFWASLEHKIYYKFNRKSPAHITEDLKDCAEMIHALDAKMLAINNEVNSL